MKDDITSRISGSSGQTAVETAIVLFATLTLLFIVIDLGRVFALHTTMAAAAQAGARAGAVSSDSADSSAQVAAAAYMGRYFDASLVTTSVNRTDDYTQVNLSYDFRPLTPLISNMVGTLSLSNSARVRELGNTDPGIGGGSGAPSATPIITLTAPPVTITVTPPTPTPSLPTMTPTATPTLLPATATPTSTPLPTNTPVPTDTPVPTNTPIPTNTPVPTPTPAPTATPEPCPYSPFICWLLGW